jgi:hypothetical protein
MILLLVARRGPLRETDGLRNRQILKRKRKNGVDKEKKILHNLVSLLLMQRRKTDSQVKPLRDVLFKN